MTITPFICYAIRCAAKLDCYMFRNRLVKSFAIGWLKTLQLVGYNLCNRLFSQEGPCYECEIEFKSVSSSLC